MKILSKEQAVQADKAAMEIYGVPSMLLMENAARSVSDYISLELLSDAKICIFCGAGNNGGDGFALARHLVTEGFTKTHIFYTGDSGKMSNETLLNFEIARKLKIPVMHITDTDILQNISLDYDCYVEALMGIGGSENLKGIITEILEKVNKSKGLKVALDIPAGLNTNTGKAHKNVFKADMTITMFAPKTGLYLNDGPKICGEIFTASLGVPQNISDSFSSVSIYEKKDIRKLLPERKKNASKFDYGIVLLIAGSELYPGAAALAANACVRAGAGLVYLASTAFHPSVFPEVIPIHLENTTDGTISKNNFQKLSEFIEKSDSIAIGPGLGSNQETIELISSLLNKFSGKRIILDADGLKCIDKNTVLSENIVLTPHIYEFCRLTGKSSADIQGNEFEAALKFSAERKCIIHLKSVPSITSDGTNSVFTTGGNPGMATGGSGDVLTGIIAAFAAMSMSLFEAASLGAYIHSIAGDLYIKENSPESLKASDLIEYLKFCF